MTYFCNRIYTIIQLEINMYLLIDGKKDKKYFYILQIMQYFGKFNIKDIG